MMARIVAERVDWIAVSLDSLVMRVFTVALLLLLGCGDDSEPVDSGSADSGGVDGGVDGGIDGGDMDGAVDSGADSAVMGPISEAEHAGVLARAWCEHQVECECLRDGLDFEGCIAEVTLRLERQAELWRERGATYQERCASEAIREIGVRGCSAYGFVEVVGCEMCELYHGTATLGEPCAPPVAGGGSSCASGLFCTMADGASELTCQDPCELFGRFVPPGEACDPAGLDGQCAPLEGLCVDDVCEAFPTLGEACPMGECSGDSYCDSDTDMCIARVDRGEPCVTGVECNTLSCDEGRCTSFCWPSPF